MIRTTPHFRLALGALLLVHTVAHAMPGIAASGSDWVWLEFWNQPWMRVTTTVLWGTALLGFGAAGLGALNVAPFAPRWHRLAAIATTASLMFLLLFEPPWFMPGLVVNLFIGAVLWRTPEAFAART